MVMPSGFNERKAAQVAAYFALREGGTINVLKLVKLIYLADRNFMKKYDCPILSDRFVSMDHGPVNSITLNLINGMSPERGDWDKFVSDRARHVVAVAHKRLTVEDFDELSKAEIDVLESVWKKFADKSGYQVRDYTHRHCPEWEDPDGSSTEIPYERVFKFLGKKNSGQLAKDIEAERALDRCLYGD